MSPWLGDEAEHGGQRPGQDAGLAAWQAGKLRRKRVVAKNRPLGSHSLLQRFQSGLGLTHTASQRLGVEFACLSDVALGTDGLPRR